MQNSSAKTMEDENKALASKLHKLQQQKKQTLKTTAKPKLQPFSKRAFIPSMTEYVNIVPNDHVAVAQQFNQKIEEMKRQKDEAELAQCTFKPQINKSTAKFIDKQNYIPVHERVYEPQQSQVMEMEEDEEYEEYERNKPGRKADPYFYERQIQWKKEQQDKITRKKINEEMMSQRELTGVPKINKRLTESATEDFVERMEHHKLKSEFKKKQLEERVYNYSFKPKVNPNSNAQPMYNKPKKYAHQNLSMNYTYKEGN